MKGAMSLKARIRNIAKEKNIPAQVILQNYMFERFLLRLANTHFKDKFVLKGGMLVAAMVGLDNRATMDLDTTLKNLPLDPTVLKQVIEEVCVVNANDDIVFSFVSIAPIRDDDIYGGFRVSLNAKYDTMLIPMSIDISTGDAITPDPVLFSFNEMFMPEQSFELWTYNIETVLAEKAETILRRGVFNTRPRDYYDAYILSTTQQYDKQVFRAALAATAKHRGTEEQIVDYDGIIERIRDSKELQNMWANYRKQFSYAQFIDYDMIIQAIIDLLH